MRLSDVVALYVNRLSKPVSGPAIIAFILCIGFSDHQGAGAIGSCIRSGQLKVVGTTNICGKTVNLFS